MIKINLIESKRQAQRKAPGGREHPDQLQDDEQKGASFGTAGAILAFLLFASIGGLYFFWINGHIKSETARGEALAAEKKELEPYLRLEQQIREQRESLKKKEAMLTKLKKQQQLPVFFWTQLANSIPDNVWFSSVAAKGSGVEVKGETQTEEAYYKFKENLEAKSDLFGNVSIGGANRKDRDRNYEFTITFDLKNP
jgi:type IV pilus assembly protein PilN